MDTPGTRQEKSGRQEQVQHQEKFVYSQENNRNHPRTEGSTGLQCPRRAGNPSSTWECGMFLDWNVPELKELTKHQLLSWLCPRRKRPEARGKSGNEGHPEDQEGWALPPHLPSTARELLPAQHLSVLQNPPLGGRGCCRSIPNTQLRFPKIPHLEIPEPSQTLRFPKIPHLEIPDPSQTLRFPKIPHLEIPDSQKSPTWRSQIHPKHSDSQKSPTWRSQIHPKHSDSQKSPTWRSQIHPKHSDSQKSPTWRSQIPQNPPLEIPDPSQTHSSDSQKSPTWRSQIHPKHSDSQKSPTWRSQIHPKHSDSQKSPTWRSQIPQNPPPGDPRSIPNTQIPKNPPLGDPRSIPNTQIPKNPPLGDPRSIPNTQIPKNPPLGDPRSIPNPDSHMEPPQFCGKSSFLQVPAALSHSTSTPAPKAPSGRENPPISHWDHPAEPRKTGIWWDGSLQDTPQPPWLRMFNPAWTKYHIPKK
ncbi:proline-rich extensin-like protein EPR1 isoform X5 [Corvus moneduloides]|uniref:proline-rich extensin-like protein EPR1 isoform X5 n=1 Tax=Corvus moneduloides TaxID=1196302 RepID=UPI001362A52B|nr:proline-rich extensin-like protein EPR1 isoform X5 [Corvus moneduloides]